jgi:histone H3/H4
MDRQPKKKKMRFYEAYISKLLKKIKPKGGITANSKQQLNSVLCSISKILADRTLEFTNMLGKKTISGKEICCIVEILFGKTLSSYITSRGNEHLQMYKDEIFRIKGVSRQDRAGIIFPLSIAERFLRNFGYTKIMLTSSASLFLAYTLEVLCEIILINACKNAKDNKRVRITIRDLELSVRNIKELDIFLTEHKIQMIGGGVVPYIHPKLTEKSKKRFKSERKTTNHRFRPGTVSLREIKRTRNC